MIGNYDKQYCAKRSVNKVRCKTTTSIIHNVLENFYSRHITYDYSGDNYIYLITRIKREGSENEYMEIIYTQFSTIFESPTKQITISWPSKMICITDNYSETEHQRYEYLVHE